MTDQIIPMKPSEFITSLSQRYNVKKGCTARMRATVELMRKGHYDEVLEPTVDAPEPPAPDPITTDPLLVTGAAKAGG